MKVIIKSILNNELTGRTTIDSVIKSPSGESEEYQCTLVIKDFQSLSIEELASMVKAVYLGGKVKSAGLRMGV